MSERKGWKQCVVCGNWGHKRKGDYCIDHTGNAPHMTWTPDKIAFLKKHYPNNGTDWVAEKLALPREKVQYKASSLKLTINKDIRQRLIYDVSSKNMTENNPMHDPETVKKVKEYWRNHPEERAEHFAKFMEGKRKSQKDKPTKLEITMFAHLDTLGVEYESFFLVKPKFIVDAKCENIIIQADGDYWHGHPRFYPLTERQLAQQKRDKAQDKYLTTCGYTVVRIWESDMSLDTVARAVNF